MALTGALHILLHVTGFTNKASRARRRTPRPAIHGQQDELGPAPPTPTRPHPTAAANSYVLTPDGIRVAVFYSKLQNRLLRPPDAASRLLRSRCAARWQRSSTPSTTTPTTPASPHETRHNFKRPGNQEGLAAIRATRTVNDGLHQVLSSCVLPPAAGLAGAPTSRSSGPACATPCRRHLLAPPPITRQAGWPRSPGRIERCQRGRIFYELCGRSCVAPSPDSRYGSTCACAGAPYSSARRCSLADRARSSPARSAAPDDQRELPQHGGRAAGRGQSDQPQHAVGSFQQDRWNDGGAKALVAARSSDGGGSWARNWAPFSACSGGDPDYLRTTDSWVSYDAAGRLYQVALSIDSAGSGCRRCSRRPRRTTARRGMRRGPSGGTRTWSTSTTRSRSPATGRANTAYAVWIRRLERPWRSSTMEVFALEPLDPVLWRGIGWRGGGGSVYLVGLMLREFECAGLERGGLGELGQCGRWRRCAVGRAGSRAELASRSGRVWAGVRRWCGRCRPWRWRPGSGRGGDGVCGRERVSSSKSSGVSRVRSSKATW